MAKKQNPLLASYERMLEKQYQIKLHAALSYGLIAGIFAANEVFQRGPGRGEKYQNAYRVWLGKMMRTIIEDSQADADLVYSRHQIREKLKEILGPEVFEKYRKELYDVLED